jgi:hypothetical protein
MQRYDLLYIIFVEALTVSDFLSCNVHNNHTPAVMIATAVIAAAIPQALANDDSRRSVSQEGRCRNCQQAANTGDDSLNTNGGIFQSRTGGG